jgi:hypothetical protein
MFAGDGAGARSFCRAGDGSGLAFPLSDDGLARDGAGASGAVKVFVLSPLILLKIAVSLSAAAIKIFVFWAVSNETLITDTSNTFERLRVKRSVTAADRYDMIERASLDAAMHASASSGKDRAVIVDE